MKKMFLMVFVVLLAVPMASYAETGEECAANCVDECIPLGSGQEYATCLLNCLKGCFDKPTPVPDVPPPQPAESSQEKFENNTLRILASNEEWIPCYKQVRMKSVIFRWCRARFPWTAYRFGSPCYLTSEACIEAEMPQSWCIERGVAD